MATPANAADPACAAMAEQLPREVHGQGRVDTTSDSPAVAAWGDPAVIWRCGVAAAGADHRRVPRRRTAWTGWCRRWTTATSFTTYGRDPAVQVLVPKAYAPEPLLLPPLSNVAADGARRASAAAAERPLRCR